MKEIPGNVQEIPDDLICAVERLASEAGDGNDWTVGTVDVNHFSVCFQLLPVRGREAGFYVKIPKHDLCLQDPPMAFPITTKDRRMGRGEFESLRCLEEHWGQKTVGGSRQQAVLLSLAALGLHAFKAHTLQDSVSGVSSGVLVVRPGVSLPAFHRPWNSDETIRLV